MGLKTFRSMSVGARCSARAAATARDVAVMLGPGGEFAFVLIGAAIAARLVDAELGRIAMVAAALSMVRAPVHRPRAWRARGASADAPQHSAEARIAPPEDVDHRAIIVGYGRVGRADRRDAGGPQDPVSSPSTPTPARRQCARRRKARLLRRRFARGVPAQLRHRKRARARRHDGCAARPTKRSSRRRANCGPTSRSSRARATPSTHARSTARRHRRRAGNHRGEPAAFGGGAGRSRRPMGSSSPRSTRSATNSASSCSPPALPIARPRRAASRRGNNHQPIRMKMRAHRLMASEAA